MSLPDPQSPGAIALLQQAIGHVTVDGEIGPQTIEALRRLDRPHFCDAFSRMLTRQYGDDGGDFIGEVMARVP